VELRRDMWEVVRKLKEDGVTIILTTHYLEEAEAMADRIGVLSKGRILLVEEKDALIRRLGRKELTIELRDRLDAVPEALAHWGLRTAGDGHRLVYIYDTHGERTGITRLLADIQAAGLHLRDVETRQSSLEEIFVGLMADEGADA
jgi:ABC-2 type transport system ATP-binding protein